MTEVFPIPPAPIGPVHVDVSAKWTIFSTSSSCPKKIIDGGGSSLSALEAE